MTKKEKLNRIIEIFKNSQPEPETELHYKSDYQLAVAVILSAQCTDKRVNLITPAFFESFPDFISLSKAKQEDVFQLIRSCSYPNNKSKHLHGLAQKVVAEYDSKLPMELNKLTTLPGIGRKTANVLLSVLENQAVLAVDTHVFRVAHRLGLVNTKAKTPLAVETQIVEIVEDKQILSKLHHWLILHGRYVCIARKPKCEICSITEFCKFFSKKNQQKLL